MRSLPALSAAALSHMCLRGRCVCPKHCAQSGSEPGRDPWGSGLWAWVLALPALAFSH